MMTSALHPLDPSITEHALAFALFAIVNAITPGPNNALAAAIGTRFGWRAALPKAIGVTIGGVALLATAAQGVSVLLERHPSVAAVFATGAAIYLLWRASGLWRARPRENLARSGRASPPGLVMATCFQFANPKAWMTALTASTFVAGMHPVLPVITLFCAINAAACFPAVIVWAYAGAALRPWLAHGKRMVWFNRAMALSLAGIAVWIFTAGMQIMKAGR